MTAPMNHTLENHMVLVSSLFPTAIFTTQTVQQQGGEAKPRRRRKRTKGADPSLNGKKKRKLTAEQINLLEQNFGTEQKLETERKDKLASELGLDPRQVAVWFQNRRARLKTQKMEEEFAKLKTSYETTMAEKCRLESEVQQLKEQLSEAEKTIQMLIEPMDALSTNSPTSVLSTETMETPLLEEFGVDAYEDIFFLPAEGIYCPCMEWEWINYLCMY